MHAQTNFPPVGMMNYTSLTHANDTASSCRVCVYRGLGGDQHQIFTADQKKELNSKIFSFSRFPQMQDYSIVHIYTEK
jgi:hypothetical protein